MLGKRPRLGPRSTRRGEALEPLRSARARSCAGAVVYAGARVGAARRRRPGAGARAHRDRRRQRGRPRRGVDNDVRDRRARADPDELLHHRLDAWSRTTCSSRPGSCTTNDDRRAAARRASSCAAPTLRRACRVGGGAVLLPGRRGRRGGVRGGRRGRHRATCRPRAVVMGVPARVVREVPDEELLLSALAGAAAAGRRPRHARARRRGRAPRWRAVVGGRGRRGSGGAARRRCRARRPTCCSRPRRRSRETAQVARARLPRGVHARERAVQPADVVRDLHRGACDSPTCCAVAAACGPFRNVRVGRRHIHHFVPGIVLAFARRRRGARHARRGRSSRRSRSRSASGWA